MILGARALYRIIWVNCALEVTDCRRNDDDDDDIFDEINEEQADFSSFLFRRRNNEKNSTAGCCLNRNQTHLYIYLDERARQGCSSTSRINHAKANLLPHHQSNQPARHDGSGGGSSGARAHPGSGQLRASSPPQTPQSPSQSNAIERHIYRNVCICQVQRAPFVLFTLLSLTKF